MRQFSRLRYLLLTWRRLRFHLPDFHQALRLNQRHRLVRLSSRSRHFFRFQVVAAVAQPHPAAVAEHHLQVAVELLCPLEYLNLEQEYYSSSAWAAPGLCVVSEKLLVFSQ